jgi:hypothetical protein
MAATSMPTSGSKLSATVLALGDGDRSRVPADSPDEISVGCLAVADRHPVDALGLSWARLCRVPARRARQAAGARSRR